LEIETHFSDPGVRNGAVKVNDDLKTLARGLHANGISQMQVGIYNGIEPFPVLCLIRVFHMYADAAGGLVHHTLADFGNRLPLTGCRLQPYIAVRRHPLSMLYHTHPALVTFGIKIMR